MDKTLFIVVLILSGLLLVAFVASPSALPGPNEQPLVFVFSHTIIRTPSMFASGKFSVGMQLKDGSIAGDPIRHAEVRFGSILLPGQGPGDYGVILGLSEFPRPLNFTINILPQTLTIPQVPAKPICVIHATQVGQFQGVQMTSPADEQVFHRSQTSHISVQWKVLPGFAPVKFWWEDNFGPLFQTLELPAGTTTYVIPLSKIPVSCTRLNIEVMGPVTNCKLDGPVTNNSHVGFDSRSHVIVTLVND